MNKIILVSFAFVFFIILTSPFINAEGEVNYCCEKTLTGAWCQNAPFEQCDQTNGLKVSPTSCASTSYCKPGCCYESREGLCMESTPLKVCADKNGLWADSASCDIPQCSLGCCVLNDQAAFVTLTRCKSLSANYGLLTDFRKTITNEATCIETAQGEDKGACVIETIEGKNCVFTTRAKCKTSSLSSDISVNGTKLLNQNASAAPGFYKDILCTSSDLGSFCGKSKKTTLVEGKDEIYYLDTCGNIANIYDSARYDDNEYWKKVFKKSESCGAGQSNANSKTCGNCDYFYGSIGKKASGIFGLGSAVYGNYICADLSCKSVGKQHGESWCVSDSPKGEGLDTVGSRYYRQVCINNEIITEPCADYRNEICIEDSFNGFSEAGCRVNRWADCLQQVEDIDCQNTAQRDCMWIEGYYFSSNSGQIEKSNDDIERGAITPDGLCVPNYPPGFNFWGSTSGTTNSLKSGNSTPSFSATTPAFGTGYVNPTSAGTTDASSQCSVGNAKLTVKWTKVKRMWPFNDEAWKCDQTFGNCQYVTDEIQNISTEEAKNWANEMNAICYKLGDCGGYINWNNVYTDEGFAAYSNNVRVAGSGGAKILEAGKTGNGSAFTGKMIQDLIKSSIEEG